MRAVGQKVLQVIVQLLGMVDFVGDWAKSFSITSCSASQVRVPVSYRVYHSYVFFSSDNETMKKFLLDFPISFGMTL